MLDAVFWFLCHHSFNCSKARETHKHVLFFKSFNGPFIFRRSTCVLWLFFVQIFNPCVVLESEGPFSFFYQKKNDTIHHFFLKTQTYWSWLSFWGEHISENIFTQHTLYTHLHIFVHTSCSGPLYLNKKSVWKKGEQNPCGMQKLVENLSVQQCLWKTST